MKPIERLRDHIRSAHPKATINISPPLRETGVWSLDVELGGRSLSIEWSAATGFGVSNVDDSNFGERHDETFLSLEKVQRRIDELLTTDSRTTPPFGVLLSRLRENVGLTQREFALRIGVRQASVSGMENRKDIQLSTLQRAIEVLGGYMEIFAVFPTARYCLGPGHLGETSQKVPGRAAETRTCEPLILQERVFVALHSVSALPWAGEKAMSIRDRRAVLEMPR
jgi:transcriptional regulator with XRE-family HTH domain